MSPTPRVRTGRQRSRGGCHELMGGEGATVGWAHPTRSVPKATYWSIARFIDSFRPHWWSDGGSGRRKA